MRWSLLFFTALGCGANTCSVAYAQTPPAITDKAATQLVADWKARDKAHEFACLYVHRENAETVAIDSVGPTGTATEMFCARTGGIARFVDEKPGEREAFSSIVAAMEHNPAWIVATEIYATLKGSYGNLTEVPLGLTVVRKPKVGNAT